MTLRTEDLGVLVERSLGPDRVQHFDHPWLAGTVPMVTPRDAGEVSELLRLCGREGRRVLPVGHGSKLAWSAPPVRVDVALSTRALAGVVAYEPGDGTLTARAGTDMARLAEVVAAGGHRLTPDVPRPGSASLGGVVAAGQSGICRLRLGPGRNHVLGLAAALGDGTSSKSGGRLVKNVTGFDLHRLHAGGKGALGVILEVSLRLFPMPAREAAHSVRFPRLATALEAAARLRAADVEPLALVVEEGFGPLESGAVLHAVFEGRVEGVARDLARTRNLLGPGEEREAGDARALLGRLRDLEPDAHEELSLHVTTRPSRLERSLDRVLEWLREHDHPRVVLVHPGLATLDVPLGRARGLDPVAGSALRSAATDLRVALAPRAQVELRGGRLALPPVDVPPTQLALEQRLRAALDPDGVMAGDLHRPAAD